MKRKTHKELAGLLGVPLTAVAIVREVLSGTSAHSGRAMEESDGDLAAAAVWLAEYRRCYRVAEAITPAVVAQVVTADNGGGRIG